MSRTAVSWDNQLRHQGKSVPNLGVSEEKTADNILSNVKLQEDVFSFTVPRKVTDVGRFMFLNFS